MPRASKPARQNASTESDKWQDHEAAETEPATVYTMAEAAALKGVSYHTVSRAVRRNKLPAQRLGRMALISAEDLRAWQPMRERAPHKYRRRTPNPEASPAVVDLSMKQRVSLALELSTIYELLHEAAVELPLAEFMSLLVERFGHAVGLKRVVVWAVDRHRNLGQRLARFGPEFSNLPDEAPLDQLVVVSRGMDLERATIFTPASFEPTNPNWVVHNLTSFLVVPLRVGTEVRGVLLADQDGEETSLTDDQLALAQALATQAALALDRARLVDEDRARADELAAILENVGEAVFASDGSGRLSVINAAGRRLLGIEKSSAEITEDLIDVVKKVQRRSLSGELIAPEEAPLLRAGRGEVVRDQRHIVIAEDGTETAVSVTAQPILGARGEQRGAVAVVRDITAEQATAERDASRLIRLETVAAQSGAVADIAMAVNASTGIETVIRTAIERMTTSLGGGQGSIFFRDGGHLVRQIAFPPALPDAPLMINGEDFPTMLTALEQRAPLFLAYDDASGRERRCLDELGTRAILIVPMIAGDEVSGAALICYPDDRRPAPDELDLAAALANQSAVAIEKARLLERVESAHRRLLAVVNALPLGVVIVDAPSGRLVLANEAAEDLVGGPLPPDVPGSLHLTGADGGAFGPGMDPLTQTLSSGIGRFSETLTLQRLDGLMVTVLANHVPVRDGAGRVVGVVSVLQDAAQLGALDRAKDEFLSVTAHELRNPLTSLHGNLQLLQRRWKDKPSRADDVRRLETILAQSDRLAQLVSRLLDVSRAELGRLDLAFADSDAAVVVRRTVESARGLSTKHETTVSAPAQLGVIWDEVRIEQVLSNLVGNAIKHTPGGQIMVTLQALPDDRILIEVRDSGPGIPEAVMVSLFDRYVRGKRRGSGEPGESSGLGLGLYISRLIARAHGGDLSAANADGGGALFALSLPRQAGRAQLPQA